MGIYIKGMEMPKSCAECRLTDGVICYGTADENDDYILGEETYAIQRARFCPLVEIPKPHGGLIDRSVLFEEYQNLCNGLLCRDCPFFKERNSCIIEEWILNQPTILRAEE